MSDFSQLLGTRLTVRALWSIGQTTVNFDERYAMSITISNAHLRQGVTFRLRCNQAGLVRAGRLRVRAKIRARERLKAWAKDQLSSRKIIAWARSKPRFSPGGYRRGQCGRSPGLK